MRTSTTTRTKTTTSPDRRTLAGLAAALALLAPVADGAAPACRPDGRYVMGTVLELALCGDVPPGAWEQAFATARELDELFTTWADDSALLRLNRAGGEPVDDVPAPVRAILAEAIGHARATHGAFDPSVGPLIEVWSDAGRRQRPPPSERLEEARARVGIARLDLRDDGSVRLPRGMALDLGGLGKGFALDRIAGDLRRAGIRSALLDFGRSSLVAIGVPPDAPAWDLLVRRPDGPIVGTVSLRDVAASVSATFGQTVRIGDRAYSHVIDPRTGRPVESERLAFVVASDASRAEALSTALVVLGPEEGLPIVEALAGTEALLVEGASGRLHRSTGFDRATRFRPHS